MLKLVWCEIWYMMIPAPDLQMCRIVSEFHLPLQQPPRRSCTASLLVLCVRYREGCGTNTNCLTVYILCGRR